MSLLLLDPKQVSFIPFFFSLTFSDQLKPILPTMRRIPSQVPSAVSRLLQGQVISSPPTWYIPALSHPPPQLPPYQVKSRPRISNPGVTGPGAGTKPGQFIDTAPIPAGELERRDRLRGYKQRKGRPLKVAYEEDRVRRQFFKDFPFEALRPVSMVEGGEIDVREKVGGRNGRVWSRGGCILLSRSECFFFFFLIFNIFYF